MKENSKIHNKTAVIYCRVSSAKQVSQGHGLGSQETRCREYAAHRGYEIAEVFRDEGVSGGLIDRPGMQAMLSFLRQHRRRIQHTVIIDDISRLARGLEAHIRLRTAITAAGGRLESPSIEFGEDSDSMLVENLLASVSQHQRQKNAEQVVNRMRARVMNGYWVFSPPVGYRYERVDGHGKMIVPDEPDASVVREAFEGFASGRFETTTEVMRYLQALPAFPRGGGALHFQFVRNLLERSLYAGYIDVAKWDIRLQPGRHTPLIGFETWQKVQDRLRGNANAPARKDLHEDFPLRGFVTCSCCAQPMTAAWSKGRNARYPYYICRTKGCAERNRAVRKERIEGEFAALLQELQPTPSLFLMAREMLADLWTARTSSVRQRAGEARAEIVRIERKSAQIMERLLDAGSHALVTAYEHQIEKLEERKIALAEKAKNCARPRGSFDETFQTACAFLANPCKLWLSDRLADKRMVLRLAFAGRLPYHRIEGFQTAIPALPFRLLAGIRGPEYGLVGAAGIEPATPTMST